MRFDQMYQVQRALQSGSLDGGPCLGGPPLLGATESAHLLTVRQSELTLNRMHTDRGHEVQRINLLAPKRR